MHAFYIFDKLHKRDLLKAKYMISSDLPHLIDELINNNGNTD